MKFEFSRKYLFFLFLTIASLWFGGYVQREINSFRTVEPEDLFDFRVYYLAGQVSHSDTDRRLYSFKETADPNGNSGLKIVNPQMQPFTPGTTYAEFAAPINPGIGQYIYPPFFATTVVPLTFLPYEKAKIVWHIMTLLFAALGIIITVRFFSDDYLTILLISLAGIILMEFTAPMRDLLMVCNIGSLILLLITAGIWLHKKYPAAAALLFALAVFIKLTPIVVVPLMIIRKQWKWLAWFSVWSLLILCFSVAVELDKSRGIFLSLDAGDVRRHSGKR